MIRKTLICLAFLLPFIFVGCTPEYTFPSDGATTVMHEDRCDYVRNKTGKVDGYCQALYEEIARRLYR